MGDARIESQKCQNVRHVCKLILAATGNDVWIGGSGIVWCEGDVLIPNFRGIPSEDIEGIREYIETEMAIMVMKRGGLGEGPPF